MWLLECVLRLVLKAQAILRGHKAVCLVEWCTACLSWHAVLASHTKNVSCKSITSGYITADVLSIVSSLFLSLQIDRTICTWFHFGLVISGGTTHAWPPRNIIEHIFNQFVPRMHHHATVCVLY